MWAAFKASIKLAAALYAAAMTTPALLINLKAACDPPGKHLLAGGERRLGSRRPPFFSPTHPLEILQNYRKKKKKASLPLRSRGTAAPDLLICSPSLEVGIRTRV